MQGVANAIGAALGNVGAIVDTIESLEVEQREGEGEKEKEERIKELRLRILERARQRAISEVVRKGAVRSEVYIHSEDVIDVAYVENRVKVRVKAIGPLRDSPSQQDALVGVEAEGPACDSSSQQEGGVSSAVDDNPHWPYASGEDEERDNAAGLSAPQVEGVCVCVHV